MLLPTPAGAVMKTETVGSWLPSIPSVNWGTDIRSSDAGQFPISTDVLALPEREGRWKSSKEGASRVLWTLVSPAKRQNKDLAQSVELIGRAPLTGEKLERAEKILGSLCGDFVVGQQAELWLAICQRLRGFDATQSFRKILKKRPDDRLAFLNLAANYLTSPIPRSDASLRVVLDLHAYTSLHPEDGFARLIEALSVKDWQRDESRALDLLEKLYADQKSFTPGFSAMAAMLSDTGRQQAGIKYAREAATQAPWNYQALSLANYEPSTVPKLFKDYLPTEHVEFVVGVSHYKSMLYGSYFLQDPLSEIEARTNIKA